MSARGHNSEAAGEKAVRVRRVRAETKTWLHSLPHDEARTEIADMLLSGIPAPLRTMMADTLLRWCRNMPSEFAEKILDKAEVPLTARLVELTPLQRRKLALVLRPV